MTVRLIEAVDPNCPTAASKELAVVALSIGKVGRSIEASSLGAAIIVLDRDTLELEDQLTRAIITDQVTYARAGALRREISSVEKAADKSRTDLGTPIRNLTANLNALYAVYTDRLKSAKNLLDMRIISWDKKLQAEARAAAEAERLRIENETLALAAAAASKEVQEEILQAGIEVAATVVAKVELVEAYGVKTGVKLVESGVLNDPRQLIAWLALVATDGAPTLTEIVEFKKSGLNKLAKWAKENGRLDANNEYAGVRWTETEGVRNY
jgi:hypothetical protein